MQLEAQCSVLIGSKRCTVCTEAKPLSDYTRDKHTPDGFNRKCRLCTNAQSKQYHDAHKELCLANNKVYRDANADVVAARKKRKSVEDREWCTYRIDTFDGKVYVGSTGHANHRRLLHIHGIRHGIHRNKHLRAYTGEQLSFTITTVYASMKEARIAERELIEQLRLEIGAGCLNIYVPQIGTDKYQPGTQPRPIISV